VSRNCCASRLDKVTRLPENRGFQCNCSPIDLFVRSDHLKQFNVSCKLSNSSHQRNHREHLRLITITARIYFLFNLTQLINLLSLVLFINLDRVKHDSLPTDDHNKFPLTPKRGNDFFSPAPNTCLGS
jgi:hypothetical protein